MDAISSEGKYPAGIPKYEAEWYGSFLPPVPNKQKTIEGYYKASCETVCPYRAKKANVLISLKSLSSG